jgi:metal-responsive CopG/Arc/MetJ family transcriptional regulator
MIEMAKLTVLIKDDLDEKFREAVFKKKGMHRGNITEAIEEAIDLWIEKEAEKETKTHGKR